MSDSPARARIPADVEREDRVLAGLTARQVAVLAVVGGGLWLGYLATRTLLPVPVFLVFAALVLAVVAAVVLGRRDGTTLDRLLVAALRQRCAPHRLVAAPDGVQPPPDWIDAAGAGPLPAPLRLPAHAISDDGRIDLGAEGTAVIITCTTVNFTLRTPEEQDATIAAFAAILHALTTPTQILIRAHRIDLDPLIDRLLRAAPALPHPALEDAALEHARFLDDLAARRDLLRREVLVIVRQPPAGTTTGHGGAGLVVARAAEAAARGLTNCGITARVLDGREATAVLTTCINPGGEHPTGPQATAGGVIGHAPDEALGDTGGDDR